LARWEYAFTPENDSPEAKLNEYLVPRDWLDEATATRGEEVL
jgi:coproporphyrinogen III oxidase